MKDDIYEDAVKFVRDGDRVSISAIQRKFKVGYNLAARTVERMEREGVVTQADSMGRREVIWTK